MNRLIELAVLYKDDNRNEVLKHEFFYPVHRFIYIKDVERYYLVCIEEYRRLDNEYGDICIFETLECEYIKEKEWKEEERIFKEYLKRREF